jgi:hypothetical protein
MKAVAPFYSIDLGPYNGEDVCWRLTAAIWANKIEDLELAEQTIRDTIFVATEVARTAARMRTATENRSKRLGRFTVLRGGAKGLERERRIGGTR